jgi:hypothetical protein
MLGALGVAAGYALGTTLMSTVWQLVLVSSTIGAGIGLAYGAMPALIMAAVQPPTASTRCRGPSAHRSPARWRSSSRLSRRPRSTDSPCPSENGFRVIMTIGSGSALIALMIAAFLPGRRPLTRRDTAPRPGDTRHHVLRRLRAGVVVEGEEGRRGGGACVGGLEAEHHDGGVVGPPCAGSGRRKCG